MALLAIAHKRRCKYVHEDRQQKDGGHCDDATDERLACEPPVGLEYTGCLIRPHVPGPVIHCGHTKWMQTSTQHKQSRVVQGPLSV